MTDLTAAQRTELLRPRSEHVLLPFLTITHGAFVKPIRVVNDPVAFVRGGNLYHASAFNHRLITDRDGTPRSQLVVQNIDRQIGAALQATSEGAILALEVLSSADFDLSQDPRTEIGTATSYADFRQFEIVSVAVDVVQVEATIECRDFSQEPWPKTRATEAILPGLFAV